MIVKRLGAIALAVILIGGAWVIRDRVIDDNGGGSGNDDPPRADREIVCVEDLRDACNTLAEELDLDIRIENAATTLDALAVLEDASDAPIWITMAPFPEMVDDLREAARADPLQTEQTAVASSPITLVVLADRGAALAAACRDPLDWTCVGDAAGREWEDIGGHPSWGLVRPAFAPIDRTIGLLGVADAVSGYFGASPIQVDDPEFVSWARPLARAVPASALSGGSAITTIQTRPSALDIAVGAVAEMSDTSVLPLTPQYADPMIRADVVVTVPTGGSVPSSLINDLERLLVTEGKWATTSTDPNPLPSAREMLAIREAWQDFA